MNFKDFHHVYEFYDTKSDNFEQVIAKIKKATENEASFIFNGYTYDKKTDFIISKKITWRNSFNPEFNVKLRNHDNSILLSGVFKSPQYTSVFFIAVYAFLLFMVLFVTWIGPPSEIIFHSPSGERRVDAPWWITYAFLASIAIFIALIQLLGTAAQKDKRDDIINLLKML